MCITDVFPLEVVQWCQYCQLCALRENSTGFFGDKFSCSEWIHCFGLWWFFFLVFFWNFDKAVFFQLTPVFATLALRFMMLKWSIAFCFFYFWWCLLWVPKPQWSALFVLGKGVHVTHSLRFTSGATPADLLTASIATKMGLKSQFSSKLRVLWKKRRCASLAPLPLDLSLLDPSNLS